MNRGGPRTTRVPRSKWANVVRATTIVMSVFLALGCPSPTQDTRTVNLAEPPGGFSLVSVSPDSVSLEWIDIGNESGYRVARSDSAVGMFPDEFEVDANATTFEDRSVVPGSTYYYRLRAEYDSGVSGWTDLLAVTVSGPPVTPALEVGATTDTQIDLEWAAADGATGYTLERGDTVSGPFVEVASPGSSARSYSDSALSPGATYYYRLAADNEFGSSEFSTVVNAQTTSVAGDVPFTVQLEALDANSVRVTWSDNNPARWYEIQRAPAGNDEFVTLTTQRSSTGSYVDVGLMVETTYRYRIRATDLISKSDWTDIAEVSTPPLPPGRAAQPSVAVDSSEQLTITWAPVSGATDYILERATSSAGPFSIVVDGGGSRTFTDTGVLSGTTYYYRVIAANGGGAGEAGPLGSATTENVQIEIGFQAGEQTALTIGLSPGAQVGSAGTLSATVSSGGDGYEWYLDAVLLEGENDQTVELDTGTLEIGTYTLTVVVTISGDRESASTNFTVVEEVAP